jgi:hypothetical protein
MTNRFPPKPFLLRFASRMHLTQDEANELPSRLDGKDPRPHVSETSKTAVPRETTDDD